MQESLYNEYFQGSTVRFWRCTNAGKKRCSAGGGPAQLEGSGACTPRLKFRVSEMPFPAFSLEHFQQINTQENAVVSCLFYSSLVLPVRYSVCEEKRPLTPSELWNNNKITKGYTNTNTPISREKKMIKILCKKINKVYVFIHISAEHVCTGAFRTFAP